MDVELLDLLRRRSFVRRGRYASRRRLLLLGLVVTLVGAFGPAATATATDPVQPGQVKVIKTQGGGTPNGGTSFTFELRSGTTDIMGNPGTLLETLLLDGTETTPWEQLFATSLTPGQTYQLCEQLPGVGWSVSVAGFTTFVPEQWTDVTRTVLNPNVVPSTKCVNFQVTPGQTLAITVDNTSPPGSDPGQVKVIKTQGGGTPNGGTSFTFELRQGTTDILGNSGTLLETRLVDGTETPPWEELLATLLTPGQTYQLCEQLPGVGWSVSFAGYTPFVPERWTDATRTVLNPNVINSTWCVDFQVTPGQTLAITVDNTSPPGGEQLPTGYWKNASSCSGGQQAPVLDQTLALFQNGGVWIGALFVDSCAEAIAILNKTSLSGKKQSGHPLFNLAAQLLAVELNLQGGAGNCQGINPGRTQAQALLNQYSFNGISYSTKLKGADAQLANSLAATFNQYNNGLLC